MYEVVMSLTKLKAKQEEMITINKLLLFNNWSVMNMCYFDRTKEQLDSRPITASCRLELHGRPDGPFK